MIFFHDLPLILCSTGLVQPPVSPWSWVWKLGKSMGILPLEWPVLKKPATDAPTTCQVLKNMGPNGRVKVHTWIGGGGILRGGSSHQFSSTIPYHRPLGRIRIVTPIFWPNLSAAPEIFGGSFLERAKGLQVDFVLIRSVATPPAEV